MQHTFTSPRSVRDIPLLSCDADPLDDADVLTLEEALGPLPADYRHFLLTSNGGRTADDAVHFPISSDSEDFHNVTSFEVMDPAFPPEVLTPTIHGIAQRLVKIAESYTSPILMRLGGPNAGTVYHWDYQLESYWRAEEASKQYLPDESSLQEIAPTFADFVQRLVRINSDEIPSIDEMDPTVSNFAKYGDHFFDEAKAYFDKLSIDELNDRWPKGHEHAFQPIHYAANWSQVRVAKYLIDRGVDIRQAITRCTNSLAISQKMIQAGATDEELRRLLFTAGMTIESTKVPEEHYKILMHLLDLGVRPDFNNADELESWALGMRQTYSKKILSLMLDVIDFPESIANPARARLAKPR